MIWSDENLRDLNKHAYAIENGKIIIGEEIELTDKKVIVIDIKNEANGYQGLAVAPIIDGRTDTTQLAVVTAGTNPKDVVDVGGAVKAMHASGSHQIKTADAWVAELRNREGYDVVQLSGHSQGAYVLKVGAKYKIPTTAFNGWFNYDTLSEAEKKVLKNNVGLFKNFRFRGDMVTFFHDMNWNTGEDFDSIIWFSWGSHGLQDWTFNKNGQVVSNGSDTENSKIASTLAGYTQSLQAYHLDKLRKKLTKSDGTLSQNAQIYLNEMEALMTVKTMQQLFQTVIQRLMYTLKKTKQDIFSVWDQGIVDAHAVGNLLTEGEILQALQIGGIDQNDVLGHTEQLENKIRQLKVIVTSFDNLIQKIQNGLAELIARDTQLAQQLN